MSASPVKIGLIGCGTIARQVHLKTLLQLPTAKVVAVAERDDARRRAVQHRVPDAHAFTDYRALLAQSDAEAVLICLPTRLHAKAAIAAMGQGKHVYVEKPLATNLEDAKEVMAAHREAGVIGMVGFNYRFNPLFQSLKRLLQKGSIGKPMYVHSVFATTPDEVPTWKKMRERGGGVLLDLGSHHVDLVRYIFEEEVASVSAHLRSYQTEQDTAVWELRLSSGLTVQSFFSLSAVEEDRFEIIGEAGQLSVDRYRSLAVKHTRPKRGSRLGQVKHLVRSLAGLPYLVKKQRAPWNEPSYREALAHFLRAIQLKQPVAVDLEAGYRSLAVVTAAEAAARTKRRVDVTRDSESEWDRASPERAGS